MLASAGLKCEKHNDWRNAHGCQVVNENCIACRSGYCVQRVPLLTYYCHVFAYVWVCCERTRTMRSLMLYNKIYSQPTFCYSILHQLAIKCTICNETHTVHQHIHTRIQTCTERKMPETEKKINNIKQIEPKIANQRIEENEHHVLFILCHFRSFRAFDALNSVFKPF